VPRIPQGDFLRGIFFMAQGHAPRSIRRPSSRSLSSTGLGFCCA
jgi:hypothetical protein